MTVQQRHHVIERIVCIIQAIALVAFAYSTVTQLFVDQC